MSTVTGPTFTPYSAARRATCAVRALATSVLVGMQPSLTQVPPRCSRSISAVFRPALASRTASGGPAWPAPITIASYEVVMGSPEARAGACFASSSLPDGGSLRPTPRRRCRRQCRRWARIAAMPAATASPRKAAAWMVGWLTAMLVMAVAGREAARTLHVFQIMEMRSVLGFVLLWPLLHASGGIAAMRTDRLGRHIARNTVHYGAQFGWFFALTMIPIAQVVAIEFTMPIWTALLAVAFLGERLGAARIIAVALGLVGVT